MGEIVQIVQIVQKIPPFFGATYTKKVRKLNCRACRIMERIDCAETEDHDWDTIFNHATPLARKQQEAPGLPGGPRALGQDQQLRQEN